MYRTLECAGGITINIESFEDSVLSATSLLMHCSHLHSVDILLGYVCACICMVGLPFLLLLFSVVVHVCVCTCIYIHCERDLLLSPMENAFCHCSLIISSHVPVNENMKYLS